MERGKTLYLADGETVLVNSYWTAHCEKQGAIIATSAWETTAGTLSGATAGDTTASVLLAEGGCGTLKNTVTLDNDEVLIRCWRVDVTN